MSTDNPSESRLACPKVGWVPEPLMNEYLNLISKPNAQFTQFKMDEYDVSDGHDKFRVFAGAKGDPHKPEDIRLIQKLTGDTEQVDTYNNKHRTKAFYENKARSLNAYYEGDAPHVDYMTGFIKPESGKKVEYSTTFDGNGKRQEFNTWTSDGLTPTQCDDK